MSTIEQNTLKNRKFNFAIPHDIASLKNLLKRSTRLNNKGIEWQ